MADEKYYESDFEEALIELFMRNGWNYTCGYYIHRTNEDIILFDDFIQYLESNYGYLNLSDSEIESVLHGLVTDNGLSVYDVMKRKLGKLRGGYDLLRDGERIPVKIDYIDFNDASNNIFRIVNQYEVKGQERIRRPDAVIFINGIPVSVFELKNPADENATVHDAYEQLHIRYVRDIPNLMCYSLISVISDGVNTKTGSLFADYDFFTSWKSTDGKTYCGDGLLSLETLAGGLFSFKTLLNVIKNYIYFPDASDEELMVMPKYSQYYASETMYENIKAHLKPEGDGKGGTYFGATGCGKSYTMLFLTRRLATDSGLNAPTVVLLSDRTDLDDQLSEIFENSKEFLVDSNTKQIKNRTALYENLRNIQSGGVYLMTVQKIDDSVNLLSDRTNIICISDEAHRTQVNLDEQDIIKDGEVHKKFGFAKYLRDSFPNATYVGFTGTPIDATVRVFGEVVCSYNMKQAVDDGSTVPMKLMAGPSEVRLDEKKLAVIDKYYEDRLSEGTNEYQVAQSIDDMAKIRTIIDNPSRLKIVAKHIIAHYEKRVEEGATSGKAMIVCYDRKIAFKLYNIIVNLRKDWALKKKSELPQTDFTPEEWEALEPIEKIKLVCTRRDDDEKKLYDLVGTKEQQKKYADLFKNNYSNFKIVIVVDMWITGFDCKALDTMYVDKPLEKHTLIQTISRVNRVFEGKHEGLIVDYIGIEASLARAMKLYASDDLSPVSEIDTSYIIFKDQLDLLDKLMHGFSQDKFHSGTPYERLKCLHEGVEFVQKTRERETAFMGLTVRMKKAYDLCVGDVRITEEEVSRTHFYCAVRSVIFKLNRGDTPDTAKMNREVKKLVDKCIVGFGTDGDSEIKVTEIFSSEYLKKIEGMPYKNTKFKMLLELLRKTIRAYSRTNRLKSLEFSKRMKAIVDRYNSREGQIIAVGTAPDGFVDVLIGQANKLLEELQADAKSFEKIGVTFQEKAFYDILDGLRDKYKFAYKDEKIIELAKEIKAVVDDKSKYLDYLNKADARANLQSDIIRALHRGGYPIEYFEEASGQIIKQVENFKKNNLA